MKEFIEKEVYHIVYDSLSDFFANTDMKNPPPTMNRSNKSQVDEIVGGRDSSWRYGDEDTYEKFTKERFSREKGYNLCSKRVRDTMADPAYKKMVRIARTFRKKVTFEDHGHRINVGKAISGEDKYFSVYKNSSRPIARIAINICGSACVDQESFRKLAETAIPTIYALEQAGIATEVWYVAFATGTHTESGIKHTATHVRLKSAQERFNWTTFAPVFTLGSYRNTIFLSWIFSKYEVSRGLGRPMNSSVMEEHENFGYSSVVGLNAPGPIKEITTVFDTLFKHTSKDKHKKIFSKK